ncbi:hypothetical protein B0H13DRAFT_1922807 [Mycena leptocephala]|nr:hypothetical protein B0H13DRAFT_1922807 [Mycena leptocephala]
MCRTQASARSFFLLMFLGTGRVFPKRVGSNLSGSQDTSRQKYDRYINTKALRAPLVPLAIPRIQSPRCKKQIQGQLRQIHKNASTKLTNRNNDYNYILQGRQPPVMVEQDFLPSAVNGSCEISRSHSSVKPDDLSW